MEETMTDPKVSEQLRNIFRYGKWRTARKERGCMCGTAISRCPKVIRVGDRYWDAGENVDGPFSPTLSYHADCVKA